MEDGHDRRPVPPIDHGGAEAGPVATSLRRRVHGLGIMVLLTYASMAILSYVQAPVLWRQEDAPRTKAFFEGLTAPLQPVLSSAAVWLAENRLLESAYPVILSYWVPLAVASVAVLLLVRSLARHGDRADPALAKLLLQWSFAFAAVCALAFPVFTQDFWLSAVWGRMIVAGVNPYYALFTPESLAGLPLDHFPMPMSYGPLWGLISAAIMFIAGDNVLAIAILFKAVIAAAWVGSLYLVFKITEGAEARERCLAISVFGWMPAGVLQSLAEGHNDIVMVVLSLLWLLLLVRGRWEAPIALAASSLCKYVTAPLLIIDAVWAIRHARVGSRTYVLRLVAPALLVLATMAIFYRSPNFFDGALMVSEWHFLRPRDAVEAIGLMLGLSLWPLAVAVSAAFPAFAAYAVWTAWQEPTFERLLQATIALMAAILFTAVSHVWPWYAVWALALAALLPNWWLSRFIIGVSILAPFTLASWWVEPFENHREVAALIMYAGAVAWMIVTRPLPLRAALTAPGADAPLPTHDARPIESLAFRIDRTGTNG